MKSGELLQCFKNIINQQHTVAVYHRGIVYHSIGAAFVYCHACVCVAIEVIAFQGEENGIFSYTSAIGANDAMFLKQLV